MNISLYSASIPVCIRALTNLAHILDKGAAHADARKIEHNVLVNARLFPDMLPLSKQVQIATDIAKGCGARLAGTEPPRYEDNEASFADLKARVQRTIEFLRSFSAAQIDDGTGPVTFMRRGEPVTLERLAYLQAFVLPNVYFHVATTYAILRHNGVELGKADFLGTLE